MAQRRRQLSIKKAKSELCTFYALATSRFLGFKNEIDLYCNSKLIISARPDWGCILLKNSNLCRKKPLLILNKTQRAGATYSQKNKQKQTSFFTKVTECFFSGYFDLTSTLAGTLISLRQHWMSLQVMEARLSGLKSRCFRTARSLKEPGFVLIA